MTHNSRLTRRQFLRRALVVVSGGALAACGADVRVAGNPWQTPTPDQALRSPMPPQTATPADNMTELEMFLSLSALLTGYDNLDPALGRIYLDSLNNHADVPMTVADLIEQVGEITEESLMEHDVFEQEDSRKLANTITNYWYTGIYTSAEGDKVATYVDTLAWKSVPQIKPRTICGVPGFWAENPEQSV